MSEEIKYRSLLPEQEVAEMSIGIIAGQIATALAGLAGEGEKKIECEMALEFKRFEDATMMRLRARWIQNELSQIVVSKQINIAHPLAGQAFANELTDTCRQVIAKQEELSADKN